MWRGLKMTDTFFLKGLCFSFYMKTCLDTHKNLLSEELLMGTQNKCGTSNEKSQYIKNLEMFVKYYVPNMCLSIHPNYMLVHTPQRYAYPYTPTICLSIQPNYRYACSYTPTIYLSIHPNDMLVHTKCESWNGICTCTRSQLIHSTLYSYTVSGQWRPWSDCTDMQADLGLHYTHMSEDTFWHDMAK